MNHHNHRESRIDNPTLSAAADLAHFRHFIRRGGFSLLFTYLPAYKAADIYVPIRHLYICREHSTNQLLFMQNKPNLVRRRRIENERKLTDNNG